jgi:hypothetical protein
MLKGNKSKRDSVGHRGWEWQSEKRCRVSGIGFQVQASLEFLVGNWLELNTQNLD